ncbi:hypothetical protein I6A84_29135 [Frankia sp. CNm7]|uniref:C2H2-type domain-containing protein n=1 Tax=Frankia nepalensis TaxID=1836974 RepID=A0A937UL33_9ACTN|nr:hypothetical protein [Frankia nepalensis]MBL7501901.1 hypothetical protein [Frankia nepalensis]MBL7513906.1 hypothetical protein [Frankia nepalensis]MBL7522032.1 hypothetical protein [Frankia nepalensis]MBL7625618.1 hypothetical protein [Frankia nepalensis]
MLYQCPRADLRCDAEFMSTGDLDDHFRWVHGYRRSGRYLAAFRPELALGGQRARRVVPGAARPTRAVPTSVDAGVVASPDLGAGATGFRPASTAGAVRARRGAQEPAGVTGQRPAGVAGRALRRLSRRRG